MKLPRFSLLNLFLIVAVVAMGCGWWVDHQSLASREHRLSDIVEKFEVIVLDHEFGNSPPSIYVQQQNGTLKDVTKEFVRGGRMIMNRD